MKTILVTGGAGFIGSEVVRRFFLADMKVVVYDNFSYGRREFLVPHERLTVIEADINDTDKLTETISTYRPQYVCHLAAIHFIPYCNAHPTEALTANTVGTESVLGACKTGGVEKVAIASSAAVYPISDDPNVEGKTPVGPVDIYGLSKVFAESLAEKFNRETNIDTISLRLFNAVGPRETNPHVLPHICESAKAGDRIMLGNVEPKRDYIHTSDIAGAIHAVFASGIRGYDVFNVGSGAEHSVVEMVEMLGKILNRKLVIKQDHARVRKTERMHLLASIDKIKQATGWQPRINLREALEDVARYYELSGNLAEAAALGRGSS